MMQARPKGLPLTSDFKNLFQAGIPIFSIELKINPLRYKGFEDSGVQGIECFFGDEPKKLIIL
jgi:hypothetical protein